jgi:hypothetical protein
MRRRTAHILLVNAALTIIGAMLVVGTAEWRLRQKHSFYELFNAGYEKPWFRGHTDLAKVFTLDPEIGFRPLVPGPQYSEFGTLHNGYDAARRSGIQRLLFAGDSVTRLGFIVDALRDLHGDESFEYWNAGVDSFNTVQELKFYRAFNRRLQPDHVILTFHNNDFETTPIVFLNEKGRLVLFSPFLPRNEINEWAFRHSYVYRMFIGRRIERGKEAARRRIDEEVQTALRDFQSMTAADGTRFTVLVHPVLSPPSEWSATERQNHRTALQLLAGLGIAHFDLTPPLEAALRDGLDPRWDRWKNDKAHPSREMAARFAAYLLDQGWPGRPVSPAAGAGH